MFKKTVLTLCLMLMPMIALGQSAGVGIVDAKGVFQTSKVAVSGMQYLQAQGAAMEKELRGLQAGLGQNATAAQQQEFQKAVADSQADFGQVQQSIATVLQEKFIAIVEAIRVADGLQVILPKDSAIAFDDAVNITERVIAEMDKETVDFKALAQTSAAEESSTQQ